MRISTVGAVALLVAGAVAGCSSPAPEQAAAPVPNQVTVADMSYSPADITVGVGDTVTWVFDDGGMAHDVVADDKAFRSPLAKSGSYSFTFTEPGTFTYHCTPHPDMVGTVTVQP
ncbi:MAG: cupredoxin family copper-binding protein [Rhodococcus sp. (in: high G+C Gram-positive bacteria)]